MAFPQVMAVFHALFDIIGLPGNLVVIVTIALESRFHVLRYILLASLAVSDFSYLILFNSFRIGSTAHERWLYGEAMCYLSPCFARYFYVNTVLHLLAVSYERYYAIVKSPLTYDGMITKCKVVFIVLIWVIPIPFSIAPFLGFGNYVYNPEIFVCEQPWTMQSVSGAIPISMAIMCFIVPSLGLAFLNWSVYKTAKSQINAFNVQMGSLAGSPENGQQELSRKMRERTAAIDVSTIVVAFLLCYIPYWTCGFLRQFFRSIEVPAEAILVTNGIAISSSLCNPIIYCFRKREFREGVRNVLRQIGLFGGNNNVIGVAN